MPTKREPAWDRCDECGRFVAYDDFDSGAAYRVLLTPDSDYSAEDWCTRCPAHKPRGHR
jgi:hypothetical protein